ncbi:MAG: hypothetical protein M3362_09965 [Acidobacteriota bacterium]|nr:hypothetical protein [Acidobacteriota bacterium]
MSSVRISRIISRLLVLALISWLIGTGYRSCCAPSGTSSTDRGAPEHHASPYAQPASDANTQAEHGTTNDEAESISFCAHHSSFIVSMPCCALSAQAFDGARKVRVVPERPAQVEKNEQPQPFVIHARGVSPGSERVINNRGETYLRDCVFLI